MGSIARRSTAQAGIRSSPPPPPTPRGARTITEISSSKLPSEILMIIFCFLSFTDLKKALLVCKWWREVAEQPALWKKLDLVHNIAKSPDCGLVELLTMSRLQALQHLTLNFCYMDQIFWEDCVHFLQVVADLCPSVKRLLWEKGGKIAMRPSPITMDKRAQNLTAQLVKFEEVLFYSQFVGEQHRYINGINEAILRAALDVEDSKLKVLTLVGDQPIDPAVLAVTQEKLTVNMNKDFVDHVGGANFCEPERGEDYMKTSHESGLNIFISVKNILNVPNFPPNYKFNECLERFKSGVPLRSLLGSPDPTKTKFSQNQASGEIEAKMTEEQADDARHIRQLDEKRKDREREREQREQREQREGDLALDLTLNTPCDYSIPLSKKNLGLTEEELRLISTRDLNILAKNKGLRREEVKEVKEARRRLKNDEMRSILSIRLKNI